jgi:hypothetical protein
MKVKKIVMPHMNNGVEIWPFLALATLAVIVTALFIKALPVILHN